MDNITMARTNVFDRNADGHSNSEPDYAFCVEAFRDFAGSLGKAVNFADFWAIRELRELSDKVHRITDCIEMMRGGNITNRTNATIDYARSYKAWHAVMQEGLEVVWATERYRELVMAVLNGADPDELSLDTYGDMCSDLQEQVMQVIASRLWQTR